MGANQPNPDVFCRVILLIQRMLLHFSLLSCTQVAKHILWPV